MSRLSDEMAKMEGRESHVYPDTAGYLTIGIGHKMTKSELDRQAVLIGGRWVPIEDGLTPLEIDQLLFQDLKWASDTVDAKVKVKLSETQRIALISFCFNVGSRAFRSSSLLSRLNAGDYNAVPGQLRLWVWERDPKGGKRKSKGLINRREAEIKLWLEPESEKT